MSDRIRLRRDVGLSVSWDDRTPAGGPFGRRLEATLHVVFAAAFAEVDAGAEPTGSTVRAALESAVHGPAFAEIATPTHDASGTLTGWELNEDVLRPDPTATTARSLTLFGDDDTQLDVSILAEQWAPVHAALADLSSSIGLSTEEVRHPGVGAMVAALDTHGFVEPADSHIVGGTFGPGATLVGHATVLVRSDRAAVLIDPFLPPRSARYPHRFQPVTVDELGTIDAVLLTHAHPDHADPATLLRLPRDVTVIVPETDRESFLAPDLAMRLGQLGFTDVRVRPWGSTVTLADLTVRVLPFFGEQPTAGPDAIHSEIVMPGNTYVVTAPWGRVACVADAGDDRRGRTRDVCRRECEANGPVSTVFAGFRGWHTSPAELLGSSVGRYFLLVPPARWSSREDLMNDPPGAVASARAFGARHLVPYADGGAPWFWELGLGPRLGNGSHERPGFDLYPERVQEASQAVGCDQSLDVVVLRPGETLTPDGRRVRHPEHEWPWPRVEDAASS